MLELVVFVAVPLEYRKWAVKMSSYRVAAKTLGIIFAFCSGLTQTHDSKYEHLPGISVNISCQCLYMTLNICQSIDFVVTNVNISIISQTTG